MRPFRGPVGSPRRGGEPPGAGGFTLVELMVTLGVLAILVSMATPSFTSVINSNRLSSQANELVADIQLARSEALRRNRTVRLCRSDNGSACATGTGNWTGWIVMLPSTTPVEVLRASTVKSPLQVSGGDTLDFRGDGLARSSSGGLASTTFSVCIPTTKPAQNMRNVELAAGARVKAVAATHTTAGACP
nr:GspH/FimT family pseudopilin [Pseudoxanthomonas suwonensis]